MKNLGEDLIEGLKNAIEYAKGDKSKGRETVIIVPEKPPEIKK